MVTPSKAGENVEKPGSSGMAGENKKRCRTVWQPPQDSMTAPQGIYLSRETEIQVHTESYTPMFRAAPNWIKLGLLAVTR